MIHVGIKETETIEDFTYLIINWYREIPEFRTSFKDAIAGVSSMPGGIKASIKYNWKQRTIEDLCDFFIDWFEHSQKLTTGLELEYIQKFSWLYYENPKGLEFVTKDYGLQMIYHFIEMNTAQKNPSKYIHLMQNWRKEITSNL